MQGKWCTVVEDLVWKLGLRRVSYCSFTCILRTSLSRSTSVRISMRNVAQLREERICVWCGIHENQESEEKPNPFLCCLVQAQKCVEISSRQGVKVFSYDCATNGRDCQTCSDCLLCSSTRLRKACNYAKTTELLLFIVEESSWRLEFQSKLWNCMICVWVAF